MLSFEGYAAYWPVLVAGPLFLGLGFWLWRTSEAAMERSVKPISWVRAYRKPVFPFRDVELRLRREDWIFPGILALAAFVYALLSRYNAGKILFSAWLLPYGFWHAFFLSLFAACGAAAVWFLLLLLFDSRYSALIGTLLFLASPLHGHWTAGLLACSCLLLALYLRKKTPGLRTELLYIGAGFCYALALAFEPALIWLAPVYPALHWFRLLTDFQNGGLDLRALGLFLALHLAVWLLFAILAALLRRVFLYDFRFRHFAELLTPLRIRYACSELLQAAGQSMFSPLMRSRMLEPLLDAPLFGFGFWGCFSAGGMALKRRRYQGWSILGLTGILGLVWLFSGCYMLSLPLALAAGSTVKNAEIGGQRKTVVITMGVGAAFSLLLLILAWALPMVRPLSWRLI